VNVLVLGGLDFQRSLPEADVINFLPHVKQPTLMLNGRYDFFLSGAIEPRAALPVSRVQERREETFDI
jgi:hypothetical protein